MDATNGVPVSPSPFLTPVINSAQIGKHRRDLLDFLREVMIDGVDYGLYPGVDALMLYDEGADLLAQRYGLVALPKVVYTEYDWTGEQHDGEPCFFVRCECEVYRDGVMLAKEERAASTWEKKHRVRKAGRVCPACGVEAILRSKAPNPEGWFCWKQKDGCGKNFPKGSEQANAIELQETGSAINVDSADLINTIEAIAGKRCYVAAVIRATGAGFLFTNQLRPGHKDAIKQDKLPSYLTAPRRQVVDAAAQSATVVAPQPVVSTSVSTPVVVVEPIKPVVVNGNGNGHTAASAPAVKAEAAAEAPSEHPLITAQQLQDEMAPELLAVHDFGEHLFGDEWTSKFLGAFTTWERGMASDKKTKPENRRIATQDHRKLGGKDLLTFYAYLRTSLENKAKAESEDKAKADSEKATVSTTTTEAVSA